jgi:hypothetical protein
MSDSRRVQIQSPRDPPSARTTTIQAELPTGLVAQARAPVAEGGAADFSSLLTDALRRFLESHSGRRTESMVLSDVASGLREKDGPRNACLEIDPTGPRIASWQGHWKWQRLNAVCGPWPKSSFRNNHRPCSDSDRPPNSRPASKNWPPSRPMARSPMPNARNTKATSAPTNSSPS